jgi:hypothetical protein
MDYQEISRLALYGGQQWAQKLKGEHDAANAIILQDRQARLDAREGVRVGDFILSGDKVLRVAHDWGDEVQPTFGNPGGSFYFSAGGGCSFSGSLDSSIPKTSLVLTEERRAGSVWFFSRDRAMAHNGYYTEAFFRVWRVC